MPFELLTTPAAQEEIDSITDPRRLRRVNGALAKLAANPANPGLHSQRYERFDDVFGEKVFESYVQNHTPGAWRIWWAYGPAKGQITVLGVGKHP